MKKSEEIQALAERYNKVEKVADALGRMIGVRRLKPSEKTRLEEMSPVLDGEVKVRDVDGNEHTISRRANLFLAASVCMINDIPITFPRRREELDAMLDRLDDEGITAAAQGLAKLVTENMEDISDKDPVEQAKNSPRTPSRGKLSA